MGHMVARGYYVESSLGKLTTCRDYGQAPVTNKERCATLAYVVEYIPSTNAKKEIAARVPSDTVFIATTISIIIHLAWLIYHTPPGSFFELDCSTTKRVPIPNSLCMSSESSRRDNPTTFFAPKVFRLLRYQVKTSTMENRPSDITVFDSVRLWYPPSFTVHAVDISLIRAVTALLRESHIHEYSSFPH